MTKVLNLADISTNLQEYLELVHKMIMEHGVARVRDLAAKKGVSSASVVTALRRLQEAGLVEYSAHQYVKMTPDGSRLAMKLDQLHKFLARFFREVLGIEAEQAEKEACSLEHHLSVTTLERMEAFFEFLHSCPRGGKELIEQFHACRPSDGRVVECHRKNASGAPPNCLLRDPQTAFLADLQPGERGKVMQLRGDIRLRRRLVDLGILPGTIISVIRYAPLGDPIEVKIMDYLLTLRKDEARSILMEREPVAVEG